MLLARNVFVCCVLEFALLGLASFAFEPRGCLHVYMRFVPRWDLHTLARLAACGHLCALFHLEPRGCLRVFVRFAVREGIQFLLVSAHCTGLFRRI